MNFPQLFSQLENQYNHLCCSHSMHCLFSPSDILLALGAARMSMFSGDGKSIKHTWLSQLLQTQVVTPGTFHKELEVASFEMKDCSQNYSMSINQITILDKENLCSHKAN